MSRPTSTVPPASPTVAAAAAVAAVAALLAGCGSGSTGSPSSPPSGPTVSASVSATSPASSPSPAASSSASGQAAPSPPDASASADVVITATVAKGVVTPKPKRYAVSLGDKVSITVTSDEPDEVHLHGYDIEAKLTPGTPGTITFTADEPGLFEVETHESGKLLFQIQVS